MNSKTVIFLNRPDVTTIPFTGCLTDVPTALNKPKHDLVSYANNDLCITVENVQINCSAHKTLMKAGASQAGKHSIMKSPRIINRGLMNTWPWCLTQEMNVHPTHASSRLCLFSSFLSCSPSTSWPLL